MRRVPYDRDMRHGQLLAATAAAVVVGLAVAAGFVVLHPALPPDGEPHAPAPAGTTGVVGAAAADERDPGPGDPGASRSGGDSAVHPWPAPDRISVGPESDQARLASADVGTRHELALELLRAGPAALQRARGLRGADAAGRDLHGRLVTALQALAINERSTDWARKPASVRHEVWLRHAATVVPEEMLAADAVRMRAERLERELRRHAKGLASDAEVALARLELRAARSVAPASGGSDGSGSDPEGDALTDADLVTEVRGWLARMRQNPRAPADRADAVERRLDAALERL